MFDAIAANASKAANRIKDFVANIMPGNTDNDSVVMCQYVEQVPNPSPCKERALKLGRVIVQGKIFDPMKGERGELVDVPCCAKHKVIHLYDSKKFNARKKFCMCATPWCDKKAEIRRDGRHHLHCSVKCRNDFLYRKTTWRRYFQETLSQAALKRLERRLCAARDCENDVLTSTTKFCGDCLAAIAQDDPEDVELFKPVINIVHGVPASVVMTCVNCINDAVSGSRFCEWCGKRAQLEAERVVSSLDPNEPGITRTERKKRCKLVKIEARRQQELELAAKKCPSCEESKEKNERVCWICWVMENALKEIEDGEVTTDVVFANFSERMTRHPKFPRLMLRMKKISEEDCRVMEEANMQALELEKQLRELPPQQEVPVTNHRYDRSNDRGGHDDGSDLGDDRSFVVQEARRREQEQNRQISHKPFAGLAVTPVTSHKNHHPHPFGIFTEDSIPGEESYDRDLSDAQAKIKEAEKIFEADSTDENFAKIDEAQKKLEALKLAPPGRKRTVKTELETLLKEHGPGDALAKEAKLKFGEELEGWLSQTLDQGNLIFYFKGNERYADARVTFKLRQIKGGKPNGDSNKKDKKNNKRDRRNGG